MTDTQRARTYSWDDPLISAKAARRMSGLELFTAMKRGELPVPPIMQTLEMSVTDFEEGRIVFSFTPREYHYNPIGSVHGGVFCTILDSAMGCAIHTTLAAGVGYTTLELKVNLTRALTTETGTVFCEGKVIHVGGRVATAEARLTDATGKLYAHATTTCLILRPDR